MIHPVPTPLPYVTSVEAISIFGVMKIFRCTCMTSTGFKAQEIAFIFFFSHADKNKCNLNRLKGNKLNKFTHTYIAINQV